MLIGVTVVDVPRAPTHTMQHNGVNLDVHHSDRVTWVTRLSEKQMPQDAGYDSPRLFRQCEECASRLPAIEHLDWLSNSGRRLRLRGGRTVGRGEFGWPLRMGSFEWREEWIGDDSVHRTYDLEARGGIVLRIDPTLPLIIPWRVNPLIAAIDLLVLAIIIYVLLTGLAILNRLLSRPKAYVSRVLSRPVFYIRRQEPARCKTCGYDVSHSPSVMCPECGQPYRAIACEQRPLVRSWGRSRKKTTVSPWGAPAATPAALSPGIIPMPAPSASSTRNPADFRIRAATADDVGIILRFIRELAEYERLAHAVEANEDSLRQTLFASSGPAAEVLIAELEPGREAVGFALFFHNYSTFLARRGLYLEDLYVTPAARGRGIGLALMRRLAGIAVERGCGRFEWAVLDWNEPSINFYRRLGAVALDDWTVFRLTGDALERLASADRGLS